MNILIPPHKKQSQVVEKLTGSLKKDIKEMKTLVGKDSYTNGRHGFAVAHCQVSENPYRLFVAKKDVLPHQVIINPKIIEKDGKFTAQEGCLSFPYRPFIKISRWFNIEVRYQDEEMQEHIKEFSGIRSQIFQHEIQHFSGNNIYGKR